MARVPGAPFVLRAAAGFAGEGLRIAVSTASSTADWRAKGSSAIASSVA
jgi:hypothetical protein